MSLSLNVILTWDLGGEGVGTVVRDLYKTIKNETPITAFMFCRAFISDAVSWCVLVLFVPISITFRFGLSIDVLWAEKIVIHDCGLYCMSI